MGGPGKNRTATDASGLSVKSNHGGVTNKHPYKVVSESSGSVTSRSSPAFGRYDGNKDLVPAHRDKNAIPVEYMELRDLKQISDFLGFGGWACARGYTVPDTLPQRPAKLNTQGKPINITLNTFNVNGFPTTVVHQYDIAWNESKTNGKRALMAKIWNSQAVKNALGGEQNLWIYDGNKLAWSGKKLKEDDLRITVDLDAEQGRPPRADATDKNVHEIFVRHTATVDFHHLSLFLNGKAQWSSGCIDAVNFLDHVLREGPAQKYVQIKKSFFDRGENRFDLGEGIEAFKGCFASLRPCLSQDLKKTLTVNVDVANGTFWRPQALGRAILQVFKVQDISNFQAMFMSAKKGDWKKAILRKDLARFKRLSVTDNGYNKTVGPNTWVIDELIGQDAQEYTFPDPDHKDKQPKDRPKVSLFDYFKRKYGMSVYRNIPVARMTKKIAGEAVHLPLDVLKIKDNQRYNTKLSDSQTSNMIKFAVTLPKERWAAVQKGVKMLDWAQDRYLQHYGIKISTQPTTVQARELPKPQLTFGGNATVQERDLVQGRWRLDGKKFIAPAPVVLREWGVCVIGGRGSIKQEQAQHFVQQFIKTFESHGGKFAPDGKRPPIVQGNLARGGEMITDVWNTTGNHFNARPRLLFFIVNDRNVDVYRRIKKSCDCRYGVASQVVQSRHAATAQGQYLSNVAMKVNAKLGGSTSWARSLTIPKLASKESQMTPTMIVAADVSHPAPGAGSDGAASFAAIAVSADVNYTRYMAECDTNGSRIEMLTQDNINNHMGNMIKKWMGTVGKGQPPKRVLYIRDGVSEGQYNAVLTEEVVAMKECFRKVGCKTIPQFTVVIAGKRHHVRFFPAQGAGDRNGNPRPGTLVETGVTHPFEFDFYLCSHVAIKGTARPIHYQVILNEAKWGGEELQQFIFEHSFQYVRSTTPVSLHPAVYYAHLAADRSRAHENVSPVSSGKKEQKPEKPKTQTGSSKSKVEVVPLLEVNNSGNLRSVMWYV